MMNTTTSRLLTGASTLMVAAGLISLGLTPAAAHVSATSTSTAAEGYTQITFSVPNESDTASTNKLEITLPTDTPFASVRVKPVEGWTAKITEEKLPEPVTIGEGAITEAVSTITWSADEQHAIGPGQFQTFTVSAGPLPAEGTEIRMPVTQSYTDGRTVAWNESAVEGQEGPQRPVPSLVTTAAGADQHAAAQPTGEASTTQASATEASTSTGLGWAGLVAGLLGLVAGVIALIRTRRTR